MKTGAESFGSVFGMAISLFETLSCRGLCPLTGRLIVMVLFDALMSIHPSFKASPGSANVSFSVWR